MGVHVDVAVVADAAALAAVAAQTFPLACPPTTTPDNIAAFVNASLSTARFASYVTDPGHLVLAAREGDRLVGYAMLIAGTGTDPDVQRAVSALPALEVNKMYALAEYHGGGVAPALIAAAVDHAQALDAASMWLGVNQQNRRAQRFYAKHGFTITGTKRFALGADVEDDYVMVRPL